MNGPRFWLGVFGLVLLSLACRGGGAWMSTFGLIFTVLALPWEVER